jgi:tetratricopeptide (TPR) repeat protein
MAARKLAAETRPTAKQVPFLQEFVAIPMLTLVRFARWDALLAESRPDESEIYLTGIWHYAQGMAQIRTGDGAAATESLLQLRLDSGDERAAALSLAGGTSNAAQLLEIAAAQLEGEIALAEGRLEAAITALEAATALHDTLAYMEPPPWYAPPRQTLGALLLADGRSHEAEAVYREDLRQYPKNGWSLLGLAQSLRAQGDDAKADWAQRGFEAAWARADVELTESRL